MNFEEYRKLTARTRPPRKGKMYERMTQSAIGLVSEAGEVAGVVEKIVFQGHDFDIAMREKLQREVGDLLWYLAMLMDETDMSLEDVMIRNIDKLKMRFPEKFSTEDSVNRVDAKNG